jgi:hypothetical protein
MSNRPEIELALDVRSYEKVVVVSNDTEAEYPTSWLRPQSIADAQVNGESVVVIDGVEVSRRSFAQLAAQSPRLFAFIVPPGDIDYEKYVRRMVNALFPVNEMWKIRTDLGTALVTKDCRGEAAEWNP